MNSPAPTSANSSLNNSVPSVVSTPIGRRSMANKVARALENDVNQGLNEGFHQAMPQFKITEFTTRTINEPEDGFHLEMDSHAYMQEQDTLPPGKKDAERGLYVVTPNVFRKKKNFVQPLAAAKDQVVDAPDNQVLNRYSPDAKKQSLEEDYNKYAIGETTSSDNIERKALELEEKLRKMKDRHERNFNTTVTDATSLFGAAIVSVMTPTKKKRKTHANDCMNKLRKVVFNRNTETPLLRRLANARRLFLFVLSERDAPSASALREMSATMDSFGNRMGTVDHEVGTVKHEVGTVKHEVGTVKHEVGTVKHEVGTVKDQVGTVVSHMGTMEDQVREMSATMGSFGNRMGTVEHEVGTVKHEVATVKHEVATRMGRMEEKLDLLIERRYEE